MSTFQHSTGIMFIDGTTGDVDKAAHEWSFTVNAGGKTAEDLGWGAATWTPDLYVNPPNGNVHTVHVQKFLKGTKKSLRALVDEHIERYGGCLCYVWPEERTEMSAWIGSGLVDIDEAAAEEDAGAYWENLPAEPADESQWQTQELP